MTGLDVCYGLCGLRGHAVVRVMLLHAVLALAQMCSLLLLL